MTEVDGQVPGKRYVWDELLAGKKPRAPRPAVVPIDIGLANANSYAKAGIEKVLAELEEATEGTRNNALNTAAFNLGQLVGAGLVGRDEIEQLLRSAGLALGLPQREVDATIRSGIDGGIRHPREIKPLGSAVAEVSAGDILDGASEGTDGPLNDDDAEDDSWAPVAVLVAAASLLAAPEPTYLRRSDGKALLYGGKVNALIGESESGKSWLALLALVQAVRDGEHVLVLDFEDNARTALTRLRAFGLDDEELELVDYASPDTPLGAKARQITDRFGSGGYGIILVDGLNAAMDLLGLDLNSNNDATTFYRRLLRPLATHGACVVAVDHIPKNPETRGKGGIGAQAKRAMIDGASIMVEVLEPFGKGQSGVLRLNVDKDRPGSVRGISTGGKVPGKVTFTSIEDRVSLVIDPPAGQQADPEDWQPTILMEKISRLLEEVGTLSGRGIREAIVGNYGYTKIAIGALVERGYVSRDRGRGNTFLYTLIKAFRCDDGSDGSDGSERFRSGSGTGQSERFRNPSSPLGDGTAQAEPLAQPYRKGTGTAPEVFACRECGTRITETEADEFAGVCRQCERRVVR